MRAVLEPADLRRYDELIDSHGAMRAHWRPLIDRLRTDESPDAVRRSLELTRRLIVENGVTYNVYADPQGADRPWALDPLPFGHPNYLWPCHGLKPVDGTWLHVYGADLARAPDGRWWLLADRTQAPSGAGYALEIREILEQVH